MAHKSNEFELSSNSNSNSTTTISHYPLASNYNNINNNSNNNTTTYQYEQHHIQSDLQSIDANEKDTINKSNKREQTGRRRRRRRRKRGRNRRNSQQRYYDINKLNEDYEQQKQIIYFNDNDNNNHNNNTCCDSHQDSSLEHQQTSQQLLFTEPMSSSDLEQSHHHHHHHLSRHHDHHIEKTREEKENATKQSRKKQQKTRRFVANHPTSNNNNNNNNNKRSAIRSLHPNAQSPHHTNHNSNYHDVELNRSTSAVIEQPVSTNHHHHRQLRNKLYLSESLDSAETDSSSSNHQLQDDLNLNQRINLTTQVKSKADNYHLFSDNSTTTTTTTVDETTNQQQQQQQQQQKDDAINDFSLLDDTDEILDEIRNSKKPPPRPLPEQNILFVDTGNYKHSPFGLRHHLSLPGAPTSPNTLHTHHQLNPNRHQQNQHQHQHRLFRLNEALETKSIGASSLACKLAANHHSSQSSMHSASYLMNNNNNINNHNNGSGNNNTKSTGSQFHNQLQQQQQQQQMQQQAPSIVLVKFCSIVYAMFLVILGCILHISELKKKTQNSVDHIYSSVVAIIGMLWLAFLHVDLQRYKRFASRFLLLDSLMDPNGSDKSSTDRMSLNTEVIFKRSAQLQSRYNNSNNQLIITASTGSNSNSNSTSATSFVPAYKFLRGKIGAGFYLKCGMAAFCFGHVVHEGLHFGQQVYFLVNDNGRCQDIPALVAHLITPLYSFYQLFIMFKYSNLVINRYKGFAYFGLMHVIGTSIAFWFRTIIEEAFDDFITKMDYFKQHHHHSTGFNDRNHKESQFYTNATNNIMPNTRLLTSDHYPTNSNNIHNNTSTFGALNDSLVNQGGVSGSSSNHGAGGGGGSGGATGNNTGGVGGGGVTRFDNVGDDDPSGHGSDPLSLSSTSSGGSSYPTYHHLGQQQDRSASNISQHIIALMSPHLSVIAPQLAATLPESYACSQNSLLTAKSMNALPYLYPFTIEYNLLIAATFLQLYFNVGKMSTNAYNNPYRSEIKQNYEGKEELEYKSNFVVSADCHAANRGLFCGFFTLLVTLVSIVIFFVSMSKPEHVELGIKINLIQETTLIMLILVVATLGFMQTTRLNRNPFIREQITTNDTLMLIPMPFFFTHSLLSVKAEYGTVTTPLREVSVFKWIAIMINLVSVVEVLVQTSFIIDGLRRCSQSRYLRFKKPGRELLTFCIILNLTLWIVSTFESKSVEQYHVEIEYYGPLSWMFVSHTTLPVMLFYRYHSSVCLAEIWGRAYKAAKSY